MAPPPPLPLRTQKSLPDAGSPAALLQGLPPSRRGGKDLLPAPVGRRLGSRYTPERCPRSTVLPDAGAGGSGRGCFSGAPAQVRGPWGAMNGTANPLLDREEHCLRLGESFEKRPRASFHTIRCKSALPTVPFVCTSCLLCQSRLPSLFLWSSKVQGTPCLRHLLSLLTQTSVYLRHPSPAPAHSPHTKAIVSPSFSAFWPNTFS